MFMEITLDQLLHSRDERHLRQQQLLNEAKGKSLVCLTVIMPGKVKRNSLSLTVAHAAVDAIRKSFAPSITYSEERDLSTGYEAYFIVDTDEKQAKQTVCSIEEEHLLGRLFDVDVIKQDGVPMSRTELGLPQRRCLLCNNEARYCMRNRTHSQAELQAEIERLVEEYRRHND